MLSSSVVTNVKRSIGQYPRLVSFPAEGVSVLLFRKGANANTGMGVVVGTSNPTTFPIGEFSDGWQEEASIDLDGTVTLKNGQ